MTHNDTSFNLSTKIELDFRVSQLSNKDIKRSPLQFVKIKPHSENKGKCRAIPSRHIIVILGFFSFIIINCQRINLSMALVAMANQTAASIFPTINSSAYMNFSRRYDFTEDNFQVIGNQVLWDAETQGHIMSASFLGFVLTNIPGGRLSETVGAKEILLFSLGCASISNILSPLASTWGAYVLLGMQLVKGLAHGFIQPAVSCIMAQWFPIPEKAFLSSVSMSGYPAGAIIGGFLSGALCDSNYFGGWPSVFYLFGFCGMILTLFIYTYLSNSPEEDKSILISELKYIISYRESTPTEKDSIIPWKRIFSSSTTWAVFVGMFGQYWLMFYFLSVHPIYIGAIMQYTNTESGYLNSLPYIGQVIIIWVSSYASDWSVKRNYATVCTVRKICNSLSCVGFALCMIGLTIAQYNSKWDVILIIIAISASGFGYPGSCIVPLDMSYNFAGTLMGIACTVASASGFIIPLIVGSLTNNQQTPQQWNKVLYISAGVALSSGIIFNLFGSANLQNWNTPTEENQQVEGIGKRRFEQNLEISPSSLSSIPLQDLNNLSIITERL
nr:sialin-like isoform X1 [Parasteatoda tepidariorum]